MMDDNETKAYDYDIKLLPSPPCCHQKQQTVLFNGMQRGCNSGSDQVFALLKTNNKYKHSPVFHFHLYVQYNNIIIAMSLEGPHHEIALFYWKTCGWKRLSFPAPKCNTEVNLKSAGPLAFSHNNTVEGTRSLSPCCTAEVQMHEYWHRCAEHASFFPPSKQLFAGLELSTATMDAPGKNCVEDVNRFMTSAWKSRGKKKQKTKSKLSYGHLEGLK